MIHEPDRPMSDEPLVWTQTEVSELLRVSPRTIRELTRTGQLRASYIGRLPRYLPADVKAYIVARRQRVA